MGRASNTQLLSLSGSQVDQNKRKKLPNFLKSGQNSSKINNAKIKICFKKLIYMKM